MKHILFYFLLGVASVLAQTKTVGPQGQGIGTGDRSAFLDALGGGASGKTLLQSTTPGAARETLELLSPPIVGNEEAIVHFMDQLMDLQTAPYPGDGKYIVVGAGGDSMGTSTGFNPYVSLELQRRFGQGAVASSYLAGGNAGGSGQYTTLVTRGAGATEVTENFTYLPNGDYYSLTTAGTATVTETPNSSSISAGYTKIRCWYGIRSGGGTLTFTVSQNGVAIPTKSVNTSVGTANTIGFVDFVAADGLVSNGRPTLVVSNATATSHYLGCYMYLGSGFIPVTVGRGGSSYAQALTSPAANLATFAAAMDMRLCFHAVKEEDKTWGNMGLMMDRWAAQHPRCSHVWVGATESPPSSEAQDPASNAAMRAKCLALKMCFVDGQRLLRDHAYLNTIGPEARGWNEADNPTIEGVDYGPHLSLPARRFIATFIVQKVLLGLQVAGGRFSPQTLSQENLGLLNNTQIPISIWAQTSSVVAASPFTQASATDFGRFTLNSAAGTPPVSSGRAGQLGRITPNLYGRTMLRYRLFDGQLQDNLTVAIACGATGADEAVLGMSNSSWGGFRIIHGVATLSGQPVPFIRFAVKTSGTAETLSPIIYHSSTTGPAPYNGGTWSGSSEHIYWVELIGNGGSLTKRFRAWHQPCEPTTGAVNTVQRRMIADWSGDVLSFTGVGFNERLWFAYISGSPAPVIGGNRSASIHGVVYDSAPPESMTINSIFQP